MRNDKSKSMISIDIILFCYKQEQYIEQALRSIYAQELPKDVTARIIVADDCSPDGTLSIIKRLAPESPFPMEFLPEEPNMGISKNYKRSFAATKADIVFILEGDDYWQENHLDQHIRFWRNYQDCSMVMSRITRMYVDANGEERIVTDGNWTYPENPYWVDVRKQIAEGNQLGNLSACSFRGEFLRELPGELFDLPVADWMIGVMMAVKKPFALLAESSSVYRVKASGVWAGRGKWKQHKTMLQYADKYDAFQQGKYHDAWRQFKKRCWRDVCRNWVHYLPSWLQLLWKRMKKNQERNG